MPEVMFAGPDGRLEGRYHHSKEPGAPLALILHPHPLHGGTMNNRITYVMYQAFQKLGFSVMRPPGHGPLRPMPFILRAIITSPSFVTSSPQDMHVLGHP